MCRARISHAHPAFDDPGRRAVVHPVLRQRRQPCRHHRSSGEDRFLSSLPELRTATERSPAALLFYAYTQPSPAVVRALGELGIPCYPTPVRAARALAHATAYAEFLEDGAA